MPINVTLLNYTSDPERAIASAARLCYAPVGADKLVKTMSDREVRRVLATIMKSGHFSALEHATYTFAIDGVSRALTHQLVRHRIASFNQQSQRYVTFSKEPDVVVPPMISRDEELKEIFDIAIDISYYVYSTLIDMGIPAEDARYVLPNACTSKIVVTMNVRELMHFFSLRCCQRAQWEIQELGNRMLELAAPTAPYVFMDAGAPCRRGVCPEGSMTCGKPFKKIVRR